jgi:hypothetical protein
MDATTINITTLGIITLIIAAKNATLGKITLGIGCSSAE